MKSTGIVRKVDELGRIVIPIELRRTLGIEIKDALEIFVDGDHILLKKYQPAMSCHVTGKVSEENIQLKSGNLVLSSEGAEKLFSELQSVLKEKM